MYKATVTFSISTKSNFLSLDYVSFFVCINAFNVSLSIYINIPIRAQVVFDFCG